MSNDVDDGVRKPRRLDCLGGKSGLIDVKLSVSVGVRSGGSQIQGAADIREQ